jgi:hypothetical protein
MIQPERNRTDQTDETSTKAAPERNLFSAPDLYRLINKAICPTKTGEKLLLAPEEVEKLFKPDARKHS